VFYILYLNVLLLVKCKGFAVFSFVLSLCSALLELCYFCTFLDPEGGSRKATLVVLVLVVVVVVVVVITSLSVQKCLRLS